VKELIKKMFPSSALQSDAVNSPDLYALTSCIVFRKK